MSKYPDNLKYTKEHEWARAEGTVYVIGVTDHAQESLGEVVYVELPKVGQQVTSGKPFGVIESTKAVSELFAPMTGKIIKVNEALKQDASSINSDPYGAGWIATVEPADPNEVKALLDAAAYQAQLPA